MDISQIYIGNRLHVSFVVHIIGAFFWPNFLDLAAFIWWFWCCSVCGGFHWFVWSVKSASIEARFDNLSDVHAAICYLYVI